jgi:membrane protein
MRDPRDGRGRLVLAERRPRRPHMPWLANFFADRCSHLAAMIAYYALLSFVPLLFLAVSALQFAGRQDASSVLVRQLHQALPGQSVDDIVRVVNDLRTQAPALGLIGVVGVVWSALGFLSAVASALNIVYEVPNRPFLRHKLRVAVIVIGFSLALLVSATVVAFVDAWARHYRPAVLGILTLQQLASLVFSTLVTAGFLFVCYRYLPDTNVTNGEVLPGVIFATFALQLSFEALPLYIRLVKTVPSLKALGGLAVLLIWFYLMGNLVMLGAEMNWWYGRGRHRAAAAIQP